MLRALAEKIISWPEERTTSTNVADLHCQTLHQSTNPPIDQSTNRPIHQSTNPSIQPPPIHQSTNPPIHRLLRLTIQKPHFQSYSNIIKHQDDDDAEPMFNIPDDADAAAPFSHLSNLLARLRNPAANQPCSA
jgi:hypothetical protein